MNRLQAENERLKLEILDMADDLVAMGRERDGARSEIQAVLETVDDMRRDEFFERLTTKAARELVDTRTRALQEENKGLKATIASLEDRLAQATQAALDFALGRPRPTQTPTQTPQQTCRDGGDNV